MRYIRCIIIIIIIIIIIKWTYLLGEYFLRLCFLRDTTEVQETQETAWISI